MKKGFTLIEILVVVAVFSILGILITQSIILTVGGSKKTESTVKVRENLNYAVGVIERQIRNADSIPVCPNEDPAILNYVDQYGNASSFSCINIGSPNGYVASSAASLTSGTVNVTGCYLNCTAGITGVPDTITIHLEGQDASASGIQNTAVTVDTQVSLRNY